MGASTTIAGRFELSELLGSGGMGEVYAARDTRSGERVAVKLQTAEGAVAAARFERESALLSRVTHPNIVRFIASGITDAKRHFLAMEWLEGEDLAARLVRGRLESGEAATLIAEVGRALAALHEHGIVHRDVKPSNVFLVGGAALRPKLLDFGIARTVAPGDRVTKTGAGVGTVGYMAPEQIRGDGALDARCDVFALGCVLFECLTGRAPFVGEHAIGIITRMMLEPAPLPSDLRPEIAPALDRLVARMLTRDRELRPRDAGEVVRALETIGDLSGGRAPMASMAITDSTAVAASRRRWVMAILGEEPPDEATLSSEEVAALERGMARAAGDSLRATTAERTAEPRPRTRSSSRAGALGAVLASGVALGALAWGLARPSAEVQTPASPGPIVTIASSERPRPAPSAPIDDAGVAASATSAPPVVSSAPRPRPARSIHVPASSSSVHSPPTASAPPCSGLDCF